MAEKIKIAELEVDDKKLLDSITRTKKAIDDLSTSQGELKKSGETSSETFVTQEAQLKTLREEYGRQIKVLQATSKNQTDLNKEVNKSVKSIKDAQNNNRELTKARNELNASTAEGRKQITEINKKIDQNNQFIKKNSSEVEQNRQNVGNYRSALSGAINSVKLFSLALKSAGIGLVIGALVQLKEAFSKNQTVVDFFTTASNALSIVLNDFVDLVVGGVDKVKAFFDDPLESVKNLGQAIKDNIIERFNSAIESISFLGAAVKAFFAGDFDKALELAKESGKEFVDVLTGVDNSLEKVTDAVSAYGSAVLEQAEAQTQLNKAADFAQVANERLLVQYQKQIEQLKQVRGDTNLTAAERIAAGEKIIGLLDEEIKLEEENARLLIARAKANEAVGDSDAGRLETQRAILNLERIQAQNETKRTEAIVGLASIRKEAKAKELEAEKQFEAQRQTLLEQIDLADAEREREKEELRVEQEFERQKNELDRLELAETQKSELLALLEERRNQQLSEIRKKDAEEQKKLAEEVRDLKIKAQQDTLDQALEIAGAETALGKTLIIAKKALALQEFFIEQKKARAEALLKAQSASADIASGTAKTASSVPFPFNLPLIAGFIAQTAGIIGAILGAVKGGSGPKFASGGILSGPSHAFGGIATPYGELEGGEAVINKRSTALFKPILSRINEAGGGRKFARGGILGEEAAIGGQFTDVDQLADKIAQANSRLPAPRVGVDEITRVASGVRVIETEASF